MNVIALQYDIAWENKAQNFNTVRRLVEAAAPSPDSIIALPEMFATGFSMNTAGITEEPGGETEQFLASLARENRAYVVAGAAMRGRDGKARNKALVFSPAGGLLAFYAKRRPFTPGGEREHYAAGEQPVAFRCRTGMVAPFVCYDLRFPELFRETVAVHRPELLVVIASWPDKRIHHWTRLLQARAIENQAYVVGVNRVGKDPNHHYNGHSAIIDPHGEIIAQADEAECILSAELDMQSLREYRRHLPFLDDLVQKP